MERKMISETILWSSILQFIGRIISSQRYPIIVKPHFSKCAHLYFPSQSMYLEIKTTSLCVRA